MLIHLIADYGTGDPAFAEVSQQLLLGFPTAQIFPLSVPPFSTLATGFWIAQLGLNRAVADRFIYHNCAPRQDDLQARANNEGEGLTYAVLPSGVKVVGVNAGYTLSFLKDQGIPFHPVNVSRGGSQFRSRDVFPAAATALFQSDLSQQDWLGSPLDWETIPDAPFDRVVWVDGYGNIKTSIPASSFQIVPETKVVIRVGDVVSDAIYSDGSFRVPQGTLAFAPGSSGWITPQGSRRWMELFLRGGSAWERFGRPRVGQQVTLLS
ncbi:MAG: hypothetical protein NW237_16845 [Cyanobacteriota bacterium]|nr:hypothetical protein [Cyanobacteriota bacterium]